MTQTNLAWLKKATKAWGRIAKLEAEVKRLRKIIGRYGEA